MKKKAISKSLLELDLESLPDKAGGKARKWTKIQDDMILKFCPTKGVPAVAAVLQIPEVSVRRRYGILRAKQ
jgi:hypothetical protein